MRTESSRYSLVLAAARCWSVYYNLFTNPITILSYVLEQNCVWYDTILFYMYWDFGFNILISWVISNKQTNKQTRYPSELLRHFLILQKKGYIQGVLKQIVTAKLHLLCTCDVFSYQINPIERPDQACTLVRNCMRWASILNSTQHK